MEQRTVRGHAVPANAAAGSEVGSHMSRQQDQQRARRDRREGLTGPERTRRERQRRAELLIAQVLDALAQRDAMVNELEGRAGRHLAEIKTLGWPKARETAEACGISIREAVRLRSLAQRDEDAGRLSVTRPTLDGSNAGE